MSRAERNKWNAKYREKAAPHRTTGAPSPLLEQLPPAAPGAWALDVGSGLLRHARALAALGYRVLAVDAAREAFRRAGPVPDGVFGLVADLDAWTPPEAAFDVIVDVHYLNRALCPALAHALRPGGWLALEIRVDPESRPGRIVRPFRLAPGEAPALFPDLAVKSADETMNTDGGLARYLFRRP